MSDYAAQGTRIQLTSSALQQKAQFTQCAVEHFLVQKSAANRSTYLRGKLLVGILTVPEDGLSKGTQIDDRKSHA